MNEMKGGGKDKYTKSKNLFKDLYFVININKIKIYLIYYLIIIA